MLKVRIPSDVIKKGRLFAEQVYNYRHGNADKFLNGAELEADLNGFEVEFANCFAFGLPFPKIFNGSKVDKFDCFLAVPNENGLLQLLKFDVKTSEEFLINKKQFERKEIDAYLFESLDFQDFQTDMIFLKFHGWIKKAEIKQNSEVKSFENGSTAYKINPAALQDPGKLFALNQARGI